MTSDIHELWWDNPLSEKHREYQNNVDATFIWILIFMACIYSFGFWESVILYLKFLVAVFAVALGVTLIGAAVSLIVALFGTITVFRIWNTKKKTRLKK